MKSHTYTICFCLLGISQFASAQYLVQPNGTAAVPDAAILGAFVGVDF